MICPFFGVCGGCSYQDLPASEYKELKKHFVQNALLQVGISANVDQLIEIGLHTRRRATFAYVNKRFGFNANKSHQVVEITECPILRPELERLITPLRTLCKTFDTDADVSVLITQSGADIAVKETHKPVKRFAKGKKHQTNKVLFLENIVDFCNENKIARFVYEGDVMYQAVQLPFPSNVFMQPSDEGEKILTDLVLVGCKDCTKIADLFCGLGTFTKPLYAQGIKVKGFDITFESITMLQKQGINADVRDLFRQPLTANELNDFDCVVLDPARAGAFAQVQQVVQSHLNKVIMVSCNPITFAKDCKILIDAGFEFEKIVLVDQFIYTQHIEVVAYLKRK